MLSIWRGAKIGRGKWHTQKTQNLVSFCPLRITRDLTRDRTTTPANGRSIYSGCSPEGEVYGWYGSSRLKQITVKTLYEHVLIHGAEVLIWNAESCRKQFMPVSLLKWPNIRAQTPRNLTQAESSHIFPWRIKHFLKIILLFFILKYLYSHNIYCRENVMF